jgi:hypothetical protein
MNRFNSRWSRILSLVGVGTRIKRPLARPFRPPNIESLADIDVADVQYGNAPVIIEGVISESGQGASIRNDEGYDVHMFDFAAWRHLDGPINEKELLVLRPIPQGDDWGDVFPPHSVQRISVLLSTCQTRSIFREAMKPNDSDPQFQAIIEKLRQPVVIHTERFGPLVLDRSIGWFEGEAQWNGQSVRLTFPVEGPLEEGLKTTEILWSDQRGWKQRVDDFAVQELLELKNDTWLGEGETPFARERFLSRMELTSISLSDDGDFEFWHDDGDLFWGHSIQVRGNVTDGPTFADIPG